MKRFDLIVGAALLGCEEPTAVPIAAAPSEMVTEATEGPAVITLEVFNQLNEGMSFSKVKKVIGVAGEETARVKLANGSTTVLIQWTNPDGSYAELAFNAGKLFSKENEHLK